jgi:hypothetical protein
MVEALTTPARRRTTLVLLLVASALAVGAIAVGVSDNPPGLLLAHLASLAIVLAFVHSWRGARRFLRLVAASVLGFVVLVVVHNLIHGLAEMAGTGTLLGTLLGVVGAAAFVGALSLCLPAFVIGVLGSLIMLMRRGQQRPGHAVPH